MNFAKILILVCPNFGDQSADKVLMVRLNFENGFCTCMGEIDDHVMHILIIIIIIINSLFQEDDIY